MNLFIMIVAGVVIAQFICGVIGVTLVFNKAFAKWYTKKMKKYIEYVTEDVCDLYEKDEL